MAHLFTIWTANRLRKAFIVVDGSSSNIYETLILKASVKLDVDGSILVREKDGTPISDDEVLLLVKSETLMLLQKDEQWVSADSDIPSRSSVSVSEPSATPSLTSTETVLSSSTVIEQNKINVFLENLPIVNMDCNYEIMWSDFAIPWHKLPSYIIQAFENDNKEHKEDHLRETVRVVVSSMRDIKTFIPSKAFKIVAKKMIDRYTNVFRDVDEDGVIMEDGSHTIFTRLQNHNNYKNFKNNKGKSGTNSINRGKKRLNSAAGCPNWQPSHSDEENERSSLEGFDKSYTEIRLFLNSSDPPAVTTILETWPIIFEKEYIIWHFNKLTGNSLLNLGKNLSEKSDKIIATTFKKEFTRSHHDKYLDTIQSVSNYFQEDLAYIYIFLKDKDFTDNMNQVILTNSPCVVGFENSSSNFMHNTDNIVLENSRYFKIYFDKVELPLQYETSIEALEASFALFYILNVQYPKQLSTTLEFIQKFLLKIHPDTGTKSKKIKTSKKRVITLMNKLKNA